MCNSDGFREVSAHPGVRTARHCPAHSQLPGVREASSQGRPRGSVLGHEPLLQQGLLHLVVPGPQVAPGVGPLGRRGLAARRGAGLDSSPRSAAAPRRLPGLPAAAVPAAVAAPAAAGGGEEPGGPQRRGAQRRHGPGRARGARGDRDGDGDRDRDRERLRRGLRSPHAPLPAPPLPAPPRVPARAGQPITAAPREGAGSLPPRPAPPQARSAPPCASRGTARRLAGPALGAMLVSGRLRRLLRRVPGRQRFGTYRFLPFFFLLGGAMEWFMIHVRIGKETFCECRVLCPRERPQPPRAVRWGQAPRGCRR
ncbi:Small integral membrane protein 4 [Aix galericulata]|nr:Small integral membrane protein 4 [Aix galericulata]